MPVPTFTETVELSAWSIVDLEIMGVLGIDVVPFLSVVLTPFVTAENACVFVEAMAGMLAVTGGVMGAV